MPEILTKISRCVKLATTAQVVAEVESKLKEKGLSNMMTYVGQCVDEIYNSDELEVRENNPMMIHEPFLGRGEFSLVLVFWHLWYRRNVRNLYIITDDKSARKYIVKNINEIPNDRILWSLKFLDEFIVPRCGMDPDTFLRLLKLLEKSEFRISKKILEFYYKKYKKSEGT